MRSCQSLTLAVSLKLEYFGNYTENGYAIYRQFHSMHQNKFSRELGGFFKFFMKGQMIVLISNISKHKT